MVRFPLRNLALLIALFGTEGLASEIDHDKGSVQEIPMPKNSAGAQKSPILLLSPTADIAFGHHSFFSTQLGGTAFVSVIPELRLGLSAAFSQHVTNSVEGCSTVDTCVRSWKRVAANAEYHHFPGHGVDFWWGLQIGTEWRQARERQTETVGDTQQPAFVLIQPGAGVDFATNVGRGVLGLGIYAGVPLSLGAKDSNIGGLLGIRGILGVH